MSPRHTHRLVPLAIYLTLWALAAVWVRHETVKTSFAVAQTRSDLKKLREETVKLRTRLEQLQSPARLERLAVDC